MDRVAHLAVRCLSFDPHQQQRGLADWAALADSEQQGFLDFGDRSGLTLHLLKAAPFGQPALSSYQERLRKNCERLRRRKQEAAELLAAFRQAGLRCALMKGFTLEPDFVGHAEDRVQYDHDFLFSRDEARVAFGVLRERGYEPLSGAERGPMDHLPALAKKTGWEWKGDFFDEDIPAAVELHYQLWDSEFERIALRWDADPLDHAIERDGWPVLALNDQLASVALHALRHVFRGSLRLSHLHEIAYFLNRHGQDEGFWRDWTGNVNVVLRRLCVTCFALSAALFHSPLVHLTAELRLIPPGAQKWLREYADRVLEPGRSAKSEVLLQLSFIENARDRMVVLRRRLLPVSLPAPVDGVYVPARQMKLRRRLLRAGRQTRFVLSRAMFHARSLFAFARLAARWRR